jgi:hypothetical protein
MPVLPNDKRPVVWYENCSFCERMQVQCTRFGKFHWMCEICEFAIVQRLKPLIKFQ